MRRTAIVLALVALTASGCTDVLPDIDTGPPLEALDATTDGVSDGPTEALETCPIRDVDVLIDQAFDLIDDQSEPDTPDSDGTYALVRTVGPTPIVLCGRSAGPQLTVGLAMGRGEVSAEAHVERLTEPGIDPEVDVTERSDYRNGQVSRLCLAYSGEPSLDVCEVVWTDTNVFVAAFAGGSAATEVDLRAVEERFLPIVQLVLEGISND